MYFVEKCRIKGNSVQTFFNPPYRPSCHIFTQTHAPSQTFPRCFHVLYGRLFISAYSAKWNYGDSGGKYGVCARKLHKKQFEGGRDSIVNVKQGLHFWTNGTKRQKMRHSKVAGMWQERCGQSSWINAAPLSLSSLVVAVDVTARKKKRLLGGQFTVVVGEMVIATDVLGATTRVPVQVTNPLR